MSCRVCRGRDSGTTDLCDTCEARAEHEQNLEDTREFGRPVAPTATCGWTSPSGSYVCVKPKGHTGNHHTVWVDAA